MRLARASRGSRVAPWAVQETHSLRRYRFLDVTALEAAAGLLPMLLPSWMDPEELIRFFGPYALWGVAFVIFAEWALRNLAGRLAAVYRRAAGRRT